MHVGSVQAGSQQSYAREARRAQRAAGLLILAILFPLTTAGP